MRTSEESKVCDEGVMSVYIKHDGKYYEIERGCDTDRAMQVGDECRRIFPGKTQIHTRDIAPRPVAGGYNALIQALEGGE